MGSRPSRDSPWKPLVALAAEGRLSGVLIGSKQGQTAQMPTRGGYSCRVKV
jgi:hypothetical protein